MNFGRWNLAWVVQFDGLWCRPIPIKLFELLYGKAQNFSVTPRMLHYEMKLIWLAPLVWWLGHVNCQIDGQIEMSNRNVSQPEFWQRDEIHHWRAPRRVGPLPKMNTSRFRLLHFRGTQLEPWMGHPGSGMGLLRPTIDSLQTLHGPSKACILLIFIEGWQWEAAVL